MSRGVRRALRIGALAAWCGAALLALNPRAALAQYEDLLPDRPDLTPTPDVVPNRRAVFEGGISFGVDRDAKTLSGPELLFRYGLLPRVELRLALPDYRRTSSSQGTHGRLGETYLGAKVQFRRAEDAFRMAAMVGFSTPADEHDRGDAAPELGVVWATPARSSLELSGGLHHRWLERARRGSNRVAATLCASRGIGVGLGTFLEWAAELSSGGPGEHLIHHGYTLGIYPDGQIDVRLGLGLTESAPDFVIGAGFVVRR